MSVFPTMLVIVLCLQCGSLSCPPCWSPLPLCVFVLFVPICVSVFMYMCPIPVYMCPPHALFHASPVCHVCPCMFLKPIMSSFLLLVSPVVTFPSPSLCLVSNLRIQV